jgi:hypothetical protein
MVLVIGYGVLGYGNRVGLLLMLEEEITPWSQL